MSSDRRNATLSDIYDFQYGKGNTIEDIGGDYPIYGSNGAVGYTDKFNSEDAPVIGHIGAYAGIVNWAAGKHYVTYNGVICKIKKGFNPRFGYYSLLVSKLQNRLRGSTQPFISYDLLDEVKIYLPDELLQNQIAKVLSDLDAKIELNNKINAELEAMAKLIYDYWFVQFDFPDANGKPYKSSGGKMVYNAELKREIPEGWEVGSLLDIGNITTGKLDSNAEVQNGEYHFFTCASTPSRTDTFAFDDAVILIAGNNAAGNFHVNRFTGKFNAYQRTYVVTSKSEIHLDYLYQVLSRQMKILKSQGKGSQTKFLTLGMITGIPIFISNDNVMRLFHNTISPLYLKQSNILLQNQKLSSLRDWLLPMLMNGQVRVGVEERLGVAAEEAGIMRRTDN